MVPGTLQVLNQDPLPSFLPPLTGPASPSEQGQGRSAGKVLSCTPLTWGRPFSTRWLCDRSKLLSLSEPQLPTRKPDTLYCSPWAVWWPRRRRKAMRVKQGAGLNTKRPLLIDPPAIIMVT